MLAIFACLGLAVAHVVYEEIIAPSLLLRLEIRLFALQDLAQVLKHDRPGEFENGSFELLKDSITTLLMLLPHINIWTVLRARRALAGNVKLREQQAVTDRTLDACHLFQAREIRDETRAIFKSALLVNCAALYAYSVLIMAPFCWLVLIARRSGRLLSIPKRDLIQLLLH
jgi:hypothetical protein